MTPGEVLFLLAKFVENVMVVLNALFWVMMACIAFAVAYLAITRSSRQVAQDRYAKHIVDLRATGDRAEVWNEEHYESLGSPEAHHLIPDVPSLYSILFTPAWEPLLNSFMEWRTPYSDEIVENLQDNVYDLIAELGDTPHLPSLWNWLVMNGLRTELPGDQVTRIQNIMTALTLPRADHPSPASRMRAAQSLINQLEG